MMLRELCSSLKTARAPKSRVIIPMTVAIIFSAWLPVLVIRSVTNFAPSTPYAYQVLNLIQKLCPNDIRFPDKPRYGYDDHK